MSDKCPRGPRLSEGSVRHWVIPFDSALVTEDEIAAVARKNHLWQATT